MNQLWVKLILFAFLLTLVLAPFAGLAPLMLCLLVLGTVWFVGSIARVLFFGEAVEEEP